MHITSLAPELSATVRWLCIWIISEPPYSAARATISTTRQFLVLDIGAISTTRTVSPSLQEFSASCVCSLVERRMYLPYSACLTWRLMSTVTVLSILLLTTRPSTVRSFFSVFSVMSARSLLLGAEEGVDASDLAAHPAGVVGLGQLASRLLHAQRELLLLQLEQMRLQLVRRLLAKFLVVHQRTVRVTKVVVTESLAAARRKASRAVASSTPSIS